MVWRASSDADKIVGIATNDTKTAGRCRMD
jgi:hypothetical protein